MQHDIKDIQMTVRVNQFEFGSRIQTVNSNNLGKPWVQMSKISSLYLHQRIGFCNVVIDRQSLLI